MRSRSPVQSCVGTTSNGSNRLGIRSCTSVTWARAMFFWRKPLLPRADFAPLLGASLAETVELETSIAGFMDVVETERHRFNEKCNDLEYQSSCLRQTQQRFASVKPLDASLRELHKCAVRLIGAEAAKGHADVFEMRVMVSSEWKLVGQGFRVFDDDAHGVQNSAREFLAALEIPPSVLAGIEAIAWENPSVHG